MRRGLGLPRDARCRNQYCSTLSELLQGVINLIICLDCTVAIEAPAPAPAPAPARRGTATQDTAGHGSR